MRDPHQLDPDHLPTPFTAEEIRAACPAGPSLRSRHERSGQPSFINVSRYASVDADGCIQEAWHESIDGTRLSVPRRDHATWLVLQQHASVPAATTTRTDETIDLPAGQFVCIRYTRTEPNAVWRFWFARDLPGQPVRLEQQIGDAVVFSAALIADMRTMHEAAGAEEGLLLQAHVAGTRSVAGTRLSVVRQRQLWAKTAYCPRPSGPPDLACTPGQSRRFELSVGQPSTVPSILIRRSVAIRLSTDCPMRC